MRHDSANGVAFKWERLLPVGVLGSPYVSVTKIKHPIGVLFLFIWSVPKSSSKSGLFSFFYSFTIKLAVFLF